MSMADARLSIAFDKIKLLEEQSEALMALVDALATIAIKDVQ